MRYVLALMVGALSVVGVAWGPANAVSAAAAGITFVQERQLELDDTPGNTVSVTVLNRDPKRRVEVQLRLLELPSQVLQVENPNKGVAGPAGTIDFRLTIQPKAEPGEGQLVAIGSDGSVARLSVRIVPPYPARIQLTEVDWRPLLPDGISTPEATLPEAAGPAAERLLGHLSGSGQERPRVKRDRAKVWVEDVRSRGRYTGTVDLTPGVGGGGSAVTLSVRDAIVYPLVVLLLVGCAVAWLDRTRGVPSAKLAPMLAVAVFVALAGLLVMYLPNPTFGSAFDYLGVALWAIVVGEALQASRRLLFAPRAAGETPKEEDAAKAAAGETPKEEDAAKAAAGETPKG
jgi:hypothetical protein